MSDINSRGQWGARYPDGDLSLSGLAGEVFVHHSVTALLPAHADPAEERQQMRALESIGQSRFGTGISYNVVIFPSGRAYQGVSWNRRGTHTGGRNSTTRSICFAGNFEKATPTDAALSTAAEIFKEGKGKWWTSGAPLRGHRDVSSTACPGKNLYSRIDVIRKGGAGLISNPVTPVKPDVGKLKVDGFWGTSTTAKFQQVMKTPIDGIVSSQERAWKAENPGLTTGWDWDAVKPNGSILISTVQERLDVVRDGVLGPDSIRAFQRRMGTPVDGVFSEESKAIMALQRRLNRNRF